jgi:hypothetical protein
VGCIGAAWEITAPIRSMSGSFLMSRVRAVLAMPSTASAIDRTTATPWYWMDARLISAMIAVVVVIISPTPVMMAW